MSNSIFRPIVLATAMALGGCGGGGGGVEVASLPPPPAPPAPPPPPAPSPSIVPAATTSQQFTSVGATHVWEGGEPLLGAADQLAVRYIQSSNSYEVQLPHSQDWGGIREAAGNGQLAFEGAVALSIRQSYQYSSVFSWGDGATYFGHDAIGVATPDGGVPVTGSASYSGNFWGQTSEINLSRPVSIYGGIDLSFDFGGGSLSGLLSPVVFYYSTYDDYGLAPVSFRETVYSTGSTTFSGKFDTNLAGVNSFSGLFTGPNAQELIGNLALPYQSPIDSKTYQADGAFLAKKH